LRDGGCRRGIADAHFAQANKIAVGRHRLVTRRNRGEELALRKSRPLGEIGSGILERKRDDAQLRAAGARKLIDRGAAGGKVCHHLHRHLGRIGGNALFRDAVIAGEHQDIDAFETGRCMALPMRKPSDDIFQAAEAVRRFRERRLALNDGGARRGLPARQVKTDRTQVGKRGKIRHGDLLPFAGRHNS